MSVNSLLNVPVTLQEWDRWSFSHAQDHLKIIQRINSLGGQLIQYQLDPMNFADLSGWEIRHLQSHLDMDAILEIQSSDLGYLNISDPTKVQEWIENNYLEHSNAHQRLGI